ncbi:SHOCT domain-containing protein [Selenomonas ruminantium]|uniref:SHOCT domain-containing protein n=1 Tax=Selenomonas ruminantium TaxID=971 RepID=UPI003529998C
MAGQDVSIVRIGVTLQKGLVLKMTRRMLRREARYQVIMVVLRSFLRQRLINKREYRMAETMMIKKYRPASGTLFSDLVLI